MGAAKDFPPVTLDQTLYDMLSAELKDGEEVETMCKTKPNSDPQYGNAVPFNDKYIIHSAQVGTAEDLAHLQLENSCHLLNFFAGPMNIVFVASEGNVDDETMSAKAVQENADRAFSVIQESQRPKVKTYKTADDFIKNHDGTKLRWGFACDFADQLPSLIGPERTYLLNSKRWLADCDLKSANDQIIDCEVLCSTHKTKEGLWYNGGKDCQECQEGIKKEVDRILDILMQAKIPYVLKLSQSLSAVGTNIVQDEKERKELIEKMREYLQDYIPRITKENAHLYTTALILSSFVPGPTHALNFYVRRDGSVLYLGGCNQLATGESGRQSTAITYKDQAELQKKFQETLDKIGKELNKNGYYGPVGADIMEHPDDGKQFTIDLNVRTPLSLVLYLLKGHFNDKHGFGIATVYECTMLSISRDELEEKFAKEFSEARIVLMGAARMGAKKQWAYGMIVAGEDKETIDKLTERILEDEVQDASAEAGGA